jgi:hypothetical protein
MRLIALALVAAVLSFTPLTARSQAESTDEQRLAMTVDHLRRATDQFSEVRRTACTIDRARNCQNIASSCGSACRNLLGRVYEQCMQTCSCNYYSCKIACGDNPSMPKSC